VLAGDVAQALGQLAEGGNLDPLGGGGAAVELAARRARGPGARPRRSCWTSPRCCSASVRAVAVVGAHDLDAELAGDLDPAGAVVTSSAAIAALAFLTRPGPEHAAARRRWRGLGARGRWRWQAAPRSAGGRILGDLTEFHVEVGPGERVQCRGWAGLRPDRLR
jgi:hypothetical protein